MCTRTSLIGAGGHAKVVLDVFTRSGNLDFNILDQSKEKVGISIGGVSVEEFSMKNISDGFHIAIGANLVRHKLFNMCNKYSNYIDIISDSSYIASSAVLGDGVFVAAKSVISASSCVGLGSIINHGAIIEHDVVVGDFCHVAPNATILGNVILGKRVFIGAGATVLPGVVLGDDVVIGAGSVVTSDVPDKCVFVGVPARNMRR